MKYKVKSGSQTHKLLKRMFESINTAEKIYAQTLKELELTGRYITSGRNLFGPILGFERKQGNLQNWRVIRRASGSDMYYPKKIKANKELLDKLESLPVIRINVLKDILNYKGYYLNCQYSDHPGIHTAEDGTLLVDCPEYVHGMWTPSPDLVEITVSEFMSIKFGREVPHA